jgi:hypothetical protein
MFDPLYYTFQTYILFLNNLFAITEIIYLSMNIFRWTAQLISDTGYSSSMNFMS